jgi:Fe-S-cluster containining protein
MATDHRPALRAELVLERAQGEEPCLFDPLLERRVNLGAISYAIVQRLDGRRTPAEIADEVALREGAPRERVVEVLRRFYLLNQVEGAGAATLARIRALKAGAEKLDLAVLEEARFACQGSGECCQNYAFGPLTDDDIARIEALEPEIRRVYPSIGPGPYVVELPAEEVRAGRYLKTVDERCVFLQPDARCGLHAAFGADSKPGLCSLYPYVALATIAGFKVYDNGECASFATSARAGPTAVDDMPRIGKLIDGGFALHHPTVLLERGTLCDYGYFVAAQSVLCDLVALGRGRAAETVVAAGRLLRRFIDALTACPLEAGEPQRTAAAALALDPDRLYAPAATPAAEGLAGIAAVAADLMRELASVISMAQLTPRDILTARLGREIAQVLHIVQTIAAHRADPAATPLPAYFAELAAVPADDPEVEAVLRISLRQTFFGHNALIEERPLAAMLRLALAVLVAIWGGRLRAAAERAPRVRPADLSFGHMLARRVFRQTAIAHVFVAHEHRASAAIEALTACL